MVLRITFLTVQVCAAICVVLTLVIHYWLNRKWIQKSLPSLSACTDEELPYLFIVLPVWNEAAIIEEKLDNLLAQKYPPTRRRIVLIDSASTDDTVSLAKAWDAKHQLNLEIIEMPARLGKSEAINRAITEIKSTDDVFVMTDADALLGAGALRRIGRRMKDEEIGAVCGSIAIDTDQTIYRDWYRWFREGESRVDSTPIFEGSIAAYRTSFLSPIDSGSNADDSQLAVQIRQSGLRAISDSAIQFHERPITDARELRARAIRRGQGLSRHFWRNRKHWFGHGTWRTILGINGVQHTLIPWVVIIGILSGVAHALTVILIGWTGSEALPLDRIMLLIDALVLFSLAIGVSGARIPLCGTIVSYLHQNLNLAYGMYLTQTGRSLHRWNQITSNRE